jgi:DNA mismatch repair protein MutL
VTECRIHVLEEEVAAQIAAGEVVERPASVVKELVENAVDAGATRVLVELRDGGRELIRVSDNGCGMTAQEAVLALQRHATSKIRWAEDLAALRTLGFRGEALPSIASVSRLTLITRARGEVEGVRLEAEGGVIRALEPAGTPEGASVAVRELFYNTPARARFLKSVRTEVGQCCETLTRLALSRPGLDLRLLVEGEELLHSPASADPLTTVTHLFGQELARSLLPVRLGRPGLVVEGYVSAPAQSRATRAGQHCYVNGRWVRSRTLAHALEEATRAVLPAGRHAFAVLHVEVDPALVDVNVHPNKLEVRFLREWEIHRAVVEAVRQALGGGPAKTAAPLARQALVEVGTQAAEPWLPPVPDPGEAAELPPSGERAAQPRLPELAAVAAPPRLIAQLWGRYLLAEGPGGLVIVDQHLAHERMLYERLRGGDPSEEATATPTGPEARELRIPVTLRLSHVESNVLAGAREALQSLGFHLEEFGRDTVALRAVPACLPPGEEGPLIRQILEELGTDPPGGTPAALHRAAAAAACRAAVRKGQKLAPAEMQLLLEEVTRLRGRSGATCPHGCPLLVEIGYPELLRRFKRG